MRVVLDTNVLSVAISRRSRFYPIWQAARDGIYHLLVTTDILNEYEEIIGEDLSPEVAHFVLETIDSLPNIAFIHKYFFWNLITVDPDDNKFVDCALAGAADYIVTDDRHFKVLAEVQFPRVQVLSSEDFLQIVLRELAASKN